MRHEADLQKQIVDALNATGLVRVRKSPVGSRRNVRLGLGTGSPDIVGWFRKGSARGRFVGVEVKRPGEKPTPEQQAWGDELLREGGAWTVATSVDGALSWVLRLANETAERG